jgi:CRISPR/Cas system CMR-associated protein Cmr1 (group 7 of RAMP superfamily)
MIVSVTLFVYLTYTINTLQSVIKMQKEMKQYLISLNYSIEETNQIDHDILQQLINIGGK